jgi:tetratricopeptide (TPR) repeat protein
MTADAILEEAFAHHGAGRLQLAEALYREILAQDADNLNALQLLGAIAIDTQRPNEAVTCLSQAAHVLQTHGKPSAQHAALYHNLGNALAAVGCSDETIASYRRGLELNPDMPELSARLASVLARQGELAAAAERYETALRLRPDHGGWLRSLADIRAALRQPEAAASLYRRMLALDPDDTAALLALGVALLALGQPAEAIEPLARCAASLPDAPAVHRALGRARLELGDLDAASDHFARAHASQLDDAEMDWLNGRLAEARRDFEAAEAAFRLALDRAPGLESALFDLGTLLYRERGRAEEAVALFQRLLAVAPGHVGVHCALGNAYRGLHQLDHAVAAYRRFLALKPDSALGHLRLGQALAELGRPGEAAAHFAASLQRDGGETLRYLAHVALGNALVKGGKVAEALPQFRAALGLQALARTPASKPEADFAALLVLAPGSFNTPYEFLIEQVPFDTNILLLLPDQAYDATFLASQADVVVNLVSDVDQDNALLPVAADLIDRLGKTVINHPQRIGRTDRQAVAELLAGIPSCRVARVARHDGKALLTPGFFESRPAPFLVRLAGRHGGDDFERIETADQLRQFVSARPDGDYFVIEYIDYRSADGYFRKYRFFMVGEAILPYHLAIGGDWKVHHFSTDMPNQAWMRQEEADFLRAPEDVFEPRHFAALHAIREAMGLEFFGVDCGLDQAGNLVVFEANATMLVHADTGLFAYKNPYIHRIKTAFGALLARAAGRG